MREELRKMIRLADAVGRVSYCPWARWCIHRLGLGRITQSIYAFVRGDGTTLKLKLNGVEGKFLVETPLELRCVEGSMLSEHELLSVIQETLKSGDVFLDVGSNIGIFTVFGAKAVGPRGTVVSCEPCTSTFNRLQKNVELNDLQNVTCLKLALSHTCSIKRLLLNNPDSFGVMAQLSDAGGPSEDVRAADYDSLIEDEGLPIPRVVKMDIEGHEYSALKGMEITLSNPACIALFCEIHPYALPCGVTNRDVIVLIESFGFESVSTRMRGREHHVTAMKPSARNVVGKRQEALADAHIG